MLMFFENDDGGIQASALHREATVLKADGNLDGAIEKLRQAKEHLMNSWTGFPHDTWCRLAKILQQAGRYDEAMIEFDFLMSDLERRIKKMCQFDNPNVMINKSRDKDFANAMVIHRSLIWNERRCVQRQEIKRLRKLQKSKGNKTSKKNK